MVLLVELFKSDRISLEDVKDVQKMLEYQKTIVMANRELKSNPYFK